jgi:hypothetical protein
VIVPFIVGVTALALCCVLPMWAARAVLAAVVTLLHRTAPLQAEQGSAIQPQSGA